METNIIVTGILKADDKFLVIKRSSTDNLYPNAWEFPGGHLVNGETIEMGLKRELKEEIGFEDEFELNVVHYFDKINKKENELIYNLELDFLINVDREKIKIKLSDEHTDCMWVTFDSDYLDDFIKEKISNIK